MHKPDKLVTTKQYIEAAVEWNMALFNGENVAILFPPVSDSQRRITQFIEENVDKYIFLEVDLLDLTVEELVDLENNLLFHAQQNYGFEKQKTLQSVIDLLRKNKRKLVVTCNLADSLLTFRGKHFLSLFQKIFLRYTPDLVFLFSFETDVTNVDSTNLIRGYNILFQHIFYYPLYSPGDVMTFINYLCKKWGIKMKSKLKNEIISKCGGYFWLVKEAIRQIRDQGLWNENSESFRYRLQTISQSFSEQEYITLTRVLTKSRSLDPDQVHIKEYLTKIGILSKKHNLLAVPLLKDEIIRLASSKRKLILSKNEVFLNQVPVTKYFSRKERSVIKLLLSNEGKVVTREEIGNVIWPLNVEEKFSEWAIDQLIKRLRERLTELLIPRTVLRSVRGKGYLYVQS